MGMGSDFCHGWGANTHMAHILNYLRAYKIEVDSAL